MSTMKDIRYLLFISLALLYCSLLNIVLNSLGSRALGSWLPGNEESFAPLHSLHSESESPSFFSGNEGSSQNKIINKDNVSSENSDKMSGDLEKDLISSSCDETIRLKDITNGESVETQNHSIGVNKILCVDLKYRAGTGYIWNLIGVYKSEPTVDVSLFPTDNFSKTYISDEIIVTTPKMKHDSTDSNDKSKEKGHDIILGGSKFAQSKIKPLKMGIYYIMYAYYRPFNSEASPNTRIIALNVK